MSKKRSLIGRRVKIVSDNDNYDRFRDNVLIITDATNSPNSNGYDTGLSPEYLCSFDIEDSDMEFPFSLYEYEFELL